MPIMLQHPSKFDFVFRRPAYLRLKPGLCYFLLPTAWCTLLLIITTAIAKHMRSPSSPDGAHLFGHSFSRATCGFLRRSHAKALRRKLTLSPSSAAA